jgi:hypothetical protein
VTAAWPPSPPACYDAERSGLLGSQQVEGVGIPPGTEGAIEHLLEHTGARNSPLPCGAQLVDRHGSSMNLRR